jgi:alpha-N-arabinofuranosidase
MQRSGISINIVALMSVVIINISASAQNKFAQLSIDQSPKTQKYSKMIFGQFIEHFHRQVYGGIFDLVQN